MTDPATRHDDTGEAAPLPTQAEEAPPGWNRPKPEHVPRPTYWPVVMALGITGFFWGFVTAPFISAVGISLFAVALIGWIYELQRGASDDD